MGTADLFSKRQKKLRGESPDVYSYDTIPLPLRVQIVHIWHDTLGDESQYHNETGGVPSAYRFIVETLCREYGLFTLAGQRLHGDRDYLSELSKFLLEEEDTERVLDAVELSFRVITVLTRKFDYLYRENASKLADNAIAELNARFQEHGVGFQFVDGKIIRIDSQLVHVDVVMPALVLLHGSQYAGAQQEFLKAHEHYRHGRAKESLAESLKALESVLKSICDKRGWPYPSNATCTVLIQTCVDRGLIPGFWLQYFSALRSTLESGVPTARNKLGGHGQGSAVVAVPQYLVAYVLHMTASCIVFLVEAERAVP